MPANRAELERAISKRRLDHGGDPGEALETLADIAALGLAIVPLEATEEMGAALYDFVGEVKWSVQVNAAIAAGNLLTKE